MFVFYFVIIGCKLLLYQLHYIVKPSLESLSDCVLATVMALVESSESNIFTFALALTAELVSNATQLFIITNADESACELLRTSLSSHNMTFFLTSSDWCKLGQS